MGSPYTYGSNTFFTANAFKRTGYNFTGWSTTPDGKGTFYKNKADAITLTQLNGATITLYAQWKPIRYSIKYKLNGGTNTKKNPSKYSIGSSTITLKNPTRKGYTFKGWYTNIKRRSQRSIKAPPEVKHSMQNGLPISTPLPSMPITRK